MPKFNHRGIAIGLVAVIALLLSITLGLAKDNQKQEFAMLDDFATEITGASGSGESKVHKDSVRIKVKAEGLLPRHQYEMKVTIGDEGVPPVMGDPIFVTCGPERSNRRGKAQFRCELDLVDITGAPGTYRLDFFVTHNHATGLGAPGNGEILSGVLDRDPLLRCAPASTHTVPE